MTTVTQSPAASTIVLALGEPYVKFYPAFAAAFGGTDEAILLQHLIDWTRKSEDGWVFRTQEEIEAATAITERRQYDALQNLKKHGVLVVERRGIPAKNYYRVVAEKIVEAIGCGSSSANSLVQFREFAEQELPVRGSYKGKKETKEEIEEENTPKVPIRRSAKPAQLDIDFEERFWQQYPKGRSSKREALAVWKTLTEEQRRMAIEAIPKFKLGHDWKNGYHRAAERFLKSGQYEDPPPPERPAGVAYFSKEEELAYRRANTTLQSYDDLL